MAILITGTTNFMGFTFSDAYVNINAIRYNKANAKLNIVTNYYKDKATRDANGSPLAPLQGFFSYSFPTSAITSDNIYTLAYNQLMTAAYPGSVTA